MPDVQLIRKTEAALRGGCRIIQYRNKKDSSTQQRQQAHALSSLCQDYNAIFIVNDDLDLALETNANGVHLGQNDLSVKVARSRVSENFIIGSTCHDSIELAQKAEGQGSNYLAFGRFFPSQTKTSAPPARLNTLKLIRQQSHLPIVAIGGITVDNAPDLIAHGAQFVAVSYDLFRYPDVDAIEKRAREYCRLFE